MEERVINILLDIKADIGELKQGQSRLDGRMGNLEGQVGNLEGRMGNLESNVSEIKTHVSELNERVGRLEDDMSDVNGLLPERPCKKSLPISQSIKCQVVPYPFAC